MRNYTLKNLGLATLILSGISIVSAGNAAAQFNQKVTMPVRSYTPPPAPRQQSVPSTPRTAPAPASHPATSPTPASHPATAPSTTHTPGSVPLAPSTKPPVSVPHPVNQTIDPKPVTPPRPVTVPTTSRSESPSARPMTANHQVQKQQQQTEKEAQKQQKQAEKEAQKQQKEAAKLAKKNGKARTVATSTHSEPVRKPLPTGNVTTHADGTRTIRDTGGREYGVRANGTISSFSGNGRFATFNSTGRVTSLHTATMDVRHTANGGRIVISHRADGATVVATGTHSGYVERTIVHGNKTYVQRTVVFNNRVVTRTFVDYRYAGFFLPHFVTPVFYSRAFYGWVYHPWVAPVHFTFGFVGAPWYLGPEPYFAVSPLYPSASFWLADYAIGETLSAAYDLHQQELAEKVLDTEAAVAAEHTEDSDDAPTLRASETTPITPELKAAIAEEIRQQIAADNTAAANPEKGADYAELPTVLREHNHVFVASDSIGVVTTDQQECQLQPGDILQLNAAPTEGSPLAQLRVASSKVTDCPAGVQVMISVQDLQDMQNNLRAQIASGLETLQKQQGQSGLPAEPADALSIPPKPSVSGLDTAPDQDAISDLDQESQRADTLERDVTQSSLNN